MKSLFLSLFVLIFSLPSMAYLGESEGSSIPKKTCYHLISDADELPQVNSIRPVQDRPEFYSPGNCPLAIFAESQSYPEVETLYYLDPATQTQKQCVYNKPQIGKSSGGWVNMKRIICYWQ